MMVSGITHRMHSRPSKTRPDKKEKCCASQTREWEEYTSRVKGITFHPVFPTSVAMATFYTILRCRLGAFFCFKKLKHKMLHVLYMLQK